MNLPNLKEFEAFLHEFSGSGPLDIAMQRFFDPYVAYSGEAGKSWDVGLRVVWACWYHAACQFNIVFSYIMLYPWM